MRKYMNCFQWQALVAMGPIVVVVAFGIPKMSIEEVKKRGLFTNSGHQTPMEIVMLP